MASELVRASDVVPLLAERLCVRRQMAAELWEAAEIQPIHFGGGRTRYRRSDIDALIVQIAEQADRNGGAP